LNPLELAQALQNLIRDFGFNQNQLGERIGKKRSTIANYLRLLALPHEIQESLKKNLISMGHAKAILSVGSLEKQQILHELILRDDLTVREAENAALKLENRKPDLKNKQKNLGAEKHNVHLEDLVEKMQQRLGTKVSIEETQTNSSGKICIDYYNLDDLDRLLNIFGCSS
jgi:ParB family chromosome partitioning protein